MFKIVMPENDGEDCGAINMTYFQMMEMLPDTAYNVTPDIDEKLRKHFSIPEGADPSKYMKVKMQSLIEEKTGRRFVKLMPNDEFRKYRLEKEKQIAEEANQFKKKYGGLMEISDWENTCQMPKPSNKSSEDSITAQTEDICHMPKPSNKPFEDSITAQTEDICHMPKPSNKPFEDSITAQTNKPSTSVATTSESVSPPEPPRGTNASLQIIKKLRQLGTNILLEANRLAVAFPEDDVAHWPANLIASAHINQIRNSPAAVALYNRGFADAKTQKAKGEKEFCLLEPAKKKPKSDLEKSIAILDRINELYARSIDQATPPTD